LKARFFFQEKLQCEILQDYGFMKLCDCCNPQFVGFSVENLELAGADN